MDVLGLAASRRDINASTMVSIIIVAAAFDIHMERNQVGSIRPSIRLHGKRPLIRRFTNTARKTANSTQKHVGYTSNLTNKCLQSWISAHDPENKNTDSTMQISVFSCHSKKSAVDKQHDGILKGGGPL